jgi:hypothetical protein
MHRPDHTFGTILMLIGIALILGRAAIARVTDPLNTRITGRQHRDGRGYVLVGIGLIIVGASAFFGLA